MTLQVKGLLQVVENVRKRDKELVFAETGRFIWDGLGNYLVKET